MDPVSRAQNSAPKPIGKPFAKGNAYRFPPGVAQNPGGRPKKSLLAHKLEELANDEGYVNSLVGAIRKRTTSKGMAAVLETRELLDRVDGKVAQMVEMEVSGKLTLEQVLQAEQRADGDSDESGFAADATSEELQDGSPEIR